MKASLKATTILKSPEVSRRGVLAGLGGMTFCLAAGTNGLHLISAAEAGTLANAQITPWVRIAPDGTITILTAGAEMGQGSMTSLPLIIAEELDADWSKVKIEWAPANAEMYGYTMGKERMMAIVGSRANQLYYNDHRIAGAQVRKVLLVNAAAKWVVDPATLKTEPGVVVNPANGQRLTYGEIAKFGTIPDPLPKVEPSELKPKSQFRLIGKSVARRDIPAKVNGTAQYAIDVKLPGMVYASTLHSPVHDSAPESWNDAEIKKMPGVIATVKLANGVAVVAEHFEQAKAAQEAIKATWTKGKASGFNSEQALERDYAKVDADPNAQATVLDTKGDAKAAFAGAAKTTRQEYRSDFGYHAQMEPMNAVARLNAAGDRIEVWEGSQAPDASREGVAKAVGLKTEQVDFHQCYLGGGFGRRSLGDPAAEVAIIAKAVGKPVKLVWTREEDIAQGQFRPQSFQSIEAAQDASGKVVGWKHTVVGDGGILLHTGIKIPYYGVPNQQIERRGVQNGVHVFFWRGVGHNANLFAIEGLVDQMAHEANMDPIDFRVQHMGLIPKGQKVFAKLAQMADLKTKRPEGRAVGISITERSGSLGAGAAEISLDRKTGKIRVHKVWLAVDGGVIVQPAAAKANLESGIIYGLSNVLHERVTIKDGAVEQSNFNDYTLMRMSDLPDEMNIEFVDVDTRPTGLGEASTVFIAAAVGNAFHKLTGKRLMHMPFTPERVLETLKA